jgi:hypothetical protein
MIQTIVAILMCLLTLILLVTARRRRSQRILLASALIAGAMTLNIDPLYLFLDRALGGRNLVTFVSDCLFVIGIFCLSAAILGSIREPGRPQKLWTAISVMLTLAVMLIAIPFIEMPGSSTRFMADFGDQLAAAIYNSVQFVYLAVVMVYTGIVILRHLPLMTTRGYIAGFRTVAIGSFAALLLVFDVLGMNMTHLFGLRSALRVLQLAYDPLFVVVMVLLCAGLAIIPGSRLARSVTRRHHTLRILSDVDDVWRRHVPASVMPSPVAGDDPEMRLHRLLIEIEDARLGPDHHATVTESELALVDRAERHLTERSGREEVPRL